MNIGGMIKNSFVDYPGKISCSIFTIGCNYRCWYCHNSHLFSTKPIITEDEVLTFLEERKGFLDGVVISGGEPTLQSDLKKFIIKIKKLGFDIKLDTNGTNFSVLKDLVENKLIDYVAMDIKAPFSKYSQIVGENTLLDEVKKSKDYLLSDVVDYEFRTTFSSDLNLDDIEEICKSIKGAKNYSIQKYNNVEYNEKNMPLKEKEEHYKALEIAKKYVKNAILKGVD